MHESAVDDTTKRTSKVGTSHACMGTNMMQCNAIRLRRKTRLGKHLSSINAKNYTKARLPSINHFNLTLPGGPVYQTGQTGHEWSDRSQLNPNKLNHLLGHTCTNKSKTFATTTDMILTLTSIDKHLGQYFYTKTCKIIHLLRGSTYKGSKTSLLMIFLRFTIYFQVYGHLN